jgi:hypothetical protein
MLRRFMLLSAVPFLMGTTALASTVLYDNGAINGTQGTGAPTISSGGVSDSFVLPSASFLTGVANVGLWLDHGSTPSTVDWFISAAPFSGFLDSGTATWSFTFLFTNAFNFDIYNASFSLPNVAVIGTRWLQLDNAVSSSGGNIFWDRSDGPSQAFDGAGIADPVGSESFQILGGPQVAAAPEPSSVLLVAGALAGILRCRRWLKR